MYTLAVDFGTTFTAAAVLGEDGVPTMVGLGNRAMQVPSTVFLAADGSVLVGEAAEREALADPSRARREIKRRIGDDVPILVGGSPYSVGYLAGQVIAWVVDRCRERYGEPPVDLVLTHPASWRQFKIDVLRQAATPAGFQDVTLCPEPVAAAMFYASRSRVEAGTRLCVYDLGGGTFDVCVVEKAGTGFRVLGAPGGLEQLGGIDFDEAVFDRVVNEIPDVVAALVPEAQTRLRRDCVEVKEALSDEVAAGVAIVHDGRSITVRVTRSEFEQMIHPALALTVDATSRALASAGIAPADLSAFVLVGGSSRIPLVAESLVATFRRPIAQDTHPKHDVVLGATLLSPNRSAEPVKAPPAAPVSDPGRSAGRRPVSRRSRVLLGVSTAAVLALAGGASWVVLGADRGSAIGAEGTMRDDGPADPTPVSGSPTAGPTASAPGPSNASGTGPATTDVTGSATSSGPPSPPGLDAPTVQWLTNLCAVQADMSTQQIPAGTWYPSVSDAKDAYVRSFALRASIAEKAAADLESRLPVVIAGGRIDPEAAAAKMRSLAQVLAQGAVALRELQPRTTRDIDAVAAEITRQAGTIPSTDLVLTPDELAYVETLRGCQNLR